MRVIAGALRGRRFDGPEGLEVRPTSDRVREAVFNRLFSLGGVEGSVVVDAFAGSGALGIEAASRGARRVVFVERDRSAAATVEGNLAALDVAALGVDVDVRRGDAVSTLGLLDGVDVVLADPPYGWSDWPDLLDAARRAGAWLVVAESGSPLELDDVAEESAHGVGGWRELSQRRYARTWVTFLENTAAAD